MKTNTKSRIALRAVLLATLGLIPAGCGGGKTTTASAGCKTIGTKVAASTTQAPGSWPYSNGDLANTRDATGSTISSANVSSLAPA